MLLEVLLAYVNLNDKFEFNHEGVAVYLAGKPLIEGHLEEVLLL